MFLFHKKDPIIHLMQHTLDKLNSSDAVALQTLDADTESTLAGLPQETKRQQATSALRSAIAFAKSEPEPQGHIFHSRDPLTGITQSHIAVKPESLIDQLQDNVIPELQAFGQDNPIVWIPTGVLAILDHFKPKAPFKIATDKSRLILPDTCKVALLADWGADNIHAKRLGELAISRGADIIIHLGDIYYSGSQSECETFVKNWPLRGSDGKPVVGKSFALNGNHEMYSLGRYYFTTVLDGLGQEASYFILSNNWWQLHGLDTAYEAFSLGGAPNSTTLKPQWDWLVGNINSNPGKKNILLSHHQPISAHLTEFGQSYPLRQEFYQLQSATQTRAIFAWFFGHEHRCTIYDDSKTYFKARLIGNGSIPHLPQEETAAEKDNTLTSTTPFVAVNKATDDEGGTVAISTFALLSFDKDKCTVEYINEDGSPFYQTENW